MRQLYSCKPGRPSDEEGNRPERLISLLRGPDANDLELFNEILPRLVDWKKGKCKWNEVKGAWTEMIYGRKLKAEIGNGSKSFGGCLFERLGGPLVEAGSRSLGGDQSGTVDIWRDAEQHLARNRLLGAASQCRAVGQIKINGIVKVRGQFLNRAPLKGNTVPDAKDFSPKNIVPRIELDSCGVSFIVHSVLHGVTPCC